jgi:D-alanine-D-alanine ligase
MAKLRVGLVYGGRSVEHEVSLLSAASIRRNLDPSRYEVWPIAIGRDGVWRAGRPGDALDVTVDRGAEVVLPAAPGAALRLSGSSVPLEVLFPIVHGHGGEDGALQGLLELAGLPYVGSGVLGSSLQMDKDVSRRLLEHAGLPICPWRRVDRHEVAEDPRATVARVVEALGLPLFVKPANSGSSVGIHKVTAAKALGHALADACRYDTKLVVERGLDAREIEVAVLGNDQPEASLPGEILPARDWYDYEAKYVDEGTELAVPASLQPEQVERLQELAVRAFRVLEGAGLGRVDFFLTRDGGEIFVNEVNSLPGFTEVSMYPQMWEASGLPYPQLLDRLLELALERHRERSALETTFRSG